MPRYNGNDIMPIKVKIGLRLNGEADHPDWNQLPLVQAGGKATDHQATGWIYDKSSGHDNDSLHSPVGQQIGVMFVSEQMANEAVAAFPGKVEKMEDEAAVETFINDHCTAHIPEYKLDTDHLVALNAEYDLLTKTGQSTTECESRIAKALDELDPSLGKRKQLSANYEAILQERNIELSPKVKRKER